ncbi:carboxypeptidase-like regulatory domain-containing protein [Hymenobacter sp. NST-14]|uniref:carboxypeptidase-like regulatory domain-containing protein n=1 Tax=Hymenobacter piscis TaxID=2839984 RepID=UPI001C02E2BA|nr:carboxypeptidase-like regulatory domain-containing protein [Hymenobacter piscis]MBT9395141.1 carboxypeptidase-like regulatory domain-containing protein [Hymenobacter piscis]
MDTNSTNTVDNPDTAPELLSAEEELSSGNSRLAIIVGAIVAIVILGYVLLPAQTTRRIAAAVPIMELGEATVTGTRPQAEVAAAPTEAEAAAAKSEASAKAPAITTTKTVAATTSAAAAVQAAAEEKAEAEAEPEVAAAPVAAPAPEPVEAAPATVNLTGRVLDEDGRPLAGATVMLKGSKKVASTDANGNYSLEVPANADNSLLYGYGGYEDQLVRTRSAKSQNVTLTPKETTRRRRR